MSNPFGPITLPKTCSRCHVKKAAYCFHVNRRHTGGLASQCKKCHAATSRESFKRRYWADRPKHWAKAEAWRKANWARWLERSRIYKRRRRAA